MKASEARALSVEELHNTKVARNFWITVDGEQPWSCTGNSALQTVNRYEADVETVMLEAGLLWHTVTRHNPALGLQASITNFVPVSTEHKVELMRVTITNTGDQPVTCTPTAAIPARS